MEPDIDLWILTCAPRSRVLEAEQLFESIPQVPVGRRVLVTTKPDPVQLTTAKLFLFDDTEINISKWWTLGLDYIASRYSEGDKWDVLIAETDARMDSGDVDVLRGLMRGFDTVQPGGDWEQSLPEDVPYLIRRDNEHSPYNRIPGIMNVVAGETGIRHDPEFRWWLADDDFEWQHRVGGGTLLVRGIPIHHLGTQGPLTGDRLQAWEEDQPKFLAKWGGTPSTNGIVR